MDDSTLGEDSQMVQVGRNNDTWDTHMASHMGIPVGAKGEMEELVQKTRLHDWHRTVKTGHKYMGKVIWFWVDFKSHRKLAKHAMHYHMGADQLDRLLERGANYAKSK